MLKKRLPSDVDRDHLEVYKILFPFFPLSIYQKFPIDFLVFFQRHLSDNEFYTLFQMNRSDFYRLPEWRRVDLKKRFKLF